MDPAFVADIKRKHKVPFTVWGLAAPRQLGGFKLMGLRRLLKCVQAGPLCALGGT